MNEDISDEITDAFGNEDEAPGIFHVERKAKWSQILKFAQTKWPGITPDQINIEAQTHNDAYARNLDTDVFVNYLAITPTEDYKLP